jgi:hypothetical protein
MRAPESGIIDGMRIRALLLLLTAVFTLTACSATSSTNDAGTATAAGAGATTPGVPASGTGVSTPGANTPGSAVGVNATAPAANAAAATDSSDIEDTARAQRPNDAQVDTFTKALRARYPELAARSQASIDDDVRNTCSDLGTGTPAETALALKHIAQRFNVTPDQAKAILALVKIVACPIS